MRLIEEDEDKTRESEEQDAAMDTQEAATQSQQRDDRARLEGMLADAEAMKFGHAAISDIKHASACVSRRPPRNPT